MLKKKITPIAANTLLSAVIAVNLRDRHYCGIALQIKAATHIIENAKKLYSSTKLQSGIDFISTRVLTISNAHFSLGPPKNISWRIEVKPISRSLGFHLEKLYISTS